MVLQHLLQAPLRDTFNQHTASLLRQLFSKPYQQSSCQRLLSKSHPINYQFTISLFNLVYENQPSPTSYSRLVVERINNKRSQLYTDIIDIPLPIKDTALAYFL